MKTIVASSALISPASNDGWLNYRTVWRWHFYAGLFCIPFVIWLSITGPIFLFKPQIERWLDRPYDNLGVAGPRATAEAQVKAALLAVPGSNLHYYELPTSPQSATRIIVGRQTEEFRVYIHPQTLQILNFINEDKRPMKIVSRLHGELLIGDRAPLSWNSQRRGQLSWSSPVSIFGGPGRPRSWRVFCSFACARESVSSGGISTE